MYRRLKSKGKHFDNMHCRKYADSESRDDPLLTRTGVENMLILFVMLHQNGSKIKWGLA